MRDPGRSRADPNRLYVNDGASPLYGGRFTRNTASFITVQSAYTLFSAIVDIDSDGDMDLFVGNSGGSDDLYINDGSGTFTFEQSEASIFTNSGQTRVAAFGDVTGDGHADVIVQGVLSLSGGAPPSIPTTIFQLHCPPN